MALLIYFGFGLVLYFFQNSYIYYPDRIAFNNCSYFDNSEKVTFGSTRMYVTNRSPDKVIVFYHGNAGRACDRDYLDIILAEKSYSSIFVEYSGYAEEDVKTNMNKVLINVTDTINFLKTRGFSEIVVSGESLGVGPASYHTSLMPIDNIILITAYNNFSSVVFSHYPVYPISLLLKNNYTPDKWLINYKGPISVILAGEDEVIPNKLGQKLYDGLISETKNISIIENARHNTIYNSLDFYTTFEKALR